MRVINKIVVHCSATPKGKHFDIDDIRRWHLANGWRDVGYHYVILLDGTIEIGRPLEIQGAGVRGHNRDTVHVCYIGGGAKAGEYKDTRTTQQKVSLVYLIGSLKRTFKCQVVGHRDFPGVKKACPCFDAIPEYRNI